jgi:hypothetical protein
LAMEDHEKLLGLHAYHLRQVTGDAEDDLLMAPSNGEVTPIELFYGPLPLNATMVQPIGKRPHVVY